MWQPASHTVSSSSSRGGGGEGGGGGAGAEFFFAIGAVKDVSGGGGAWRPATRCGGEGGVGLRGVCVRARVCVWGGGVLCCGEVLWGSPCVGQAVQEGVRVPGRGG